MKEGGVENTYFRNDKATAHITCWTIQLLNDDIPKRLILQNDDLVWPVRSLGLTAPDYFLWDFLKSGVHVNKPQLIQ